MSDARPLQEEFARAAEGFARRTEGRFAGMDVVGFSRARPDETVCEVGAGTGNFLALFEGHSARRVAVDLTMEMLQQARRHPGMELVAGDGTRLPLRSGAVHLAASAQVLHHIHEPVPFLRELRRVAGPGGRVLVVDQHATENLEQAHAMTQLEWIRDPTHAVSRSPSALRVVLLAAGLRVVDEALWEGRSRLSEWMWPGEFPADRIADVRAAIERFGDQTGMDWEREGDDWSFTRRRIMLLAAR